jgi:hypothetical protein
MLLVLWIGLLTLINCVNAAIIRPNADDPKPWESSLAFRPSPIYLLHGFGKGEVNDWSPTIEDMMLIGKTEEGRGYYDPYRKMDTDGELLTYVHAINFHPNVEETQNMIERNSSIDTFQAGDTYVAEGLKLDPSDTRVMLYPGDDGWADRLYDFIKGEYSGELIPSLTDIDRYQAGKGILVGHSMGGLVARELVTNQKYSDENSKIKEVITISAPHTGTFLSNTIRTIHATRAIGIVMLGMSGVFSPLNATITDYAENHEYIDMNGDALRDMEIGSEFLDTLNYDRDQRGDAIDYSIIASYVGRFDFDDGVHVQPLVGGDNEVLGGDGVVSLHSQRARDPRDPYRCLLPKVDEAIIYALHGESRRIASLPQTDGSPAPLLKMIAGEPKLQVLPYYDPLFFSASIPVYMTIKGEYFPQQCKLSIFDKQENGDYELRTGVADRTGRVLPDDLWDSHEDDPIVASMLEYVSLTGERAETKFELKNVANKKNTASVIVLKTTARAFLKKEKVQEIQKDTVVTAAYINSFWSQILGASVTQGYPTYGNMYTSPPRSNGYRGMTLFQPLYYGSIDPMAMKHIGYYKSATQNGRIYGSLSRGYISFDTDMLSAETKGAIGQTPEKVKVFLGYYGALTNKLLLPTDKVVIKRASFGPNITAGAWGSGDSIAGTFSFEDSKNGTLLDINHAGTLRIFKEIELPLTMIDINGKTQFEILFDTQDMPELIQTSTTSKEGEHVFYMSLMDIRSRHYPLGEAPYSPYLKICF